MHQWLDALLAAFGGESASFGEHRAYPPPLARAGRGALAGLIATVPMSLTMVALFRTLPQDERYPIAPAILTSEVVERALHRHLNPPARMALTLASHFAYGASMGAVAGPFARRLRLPGPFAGILAGIGVWALNYAAALPSLGLLRPEAQRPAPRRLLLFTAHLTWGVTLGWVISAIEPEQVNVPVKPRSLGPEARHAG